jgi:fructokinase
MGQMLLGGIEAGGTKFRCAIGTPLGTILSSATIPTRSPKDTLRDVGRFFRSQRTRFPIEALGIASFGPVDLRPTSPLYGHITSTPKLEWRDFDMVRHAGRSTGVREITLDTDVNAAVLAEAKWGAGREVDPLLYVTLGTGVGGATFVNGDIIRGLLHPEMGHIRIPRQPADTFEGCCPSHGDCFEGLASGKAMALRWGVPAHDLPRSHEGWALETRYVAMALANLILTFSPKRVIVGGGLTKKLRWTLLRATIRELLNGYLDAPELNALIGEYIVRPGLGNDSGVVGAIALASMRAVRLHADETVTPPEGRALRSFDRRDADRLKTREPRV